MSHIEHQDQLKQNSIQNLKLEQQQQNIKEQNQKEPIKESFNTSDQLAYHQIAQYLSKINLKINQTKNKYLTDPNKIVDAKITELAEKLIVSKQNSEIIMKEDLKPDINQSYDTMVVDIYTENKRLKRQIVEMIDLLKKQQHKLYQHLNTENSLRQQNQELRRKLFSYQDDQILHSGIKVKQHTNKKNNNIVDKMKPSNEEKNRIKSEQDDVDFWNMSSNNNYMKKKKKEEIDSNLWVNQNQLQESVFITEQKKSKK